jgi:hypothetical protein
MLTGTLQASWSSPQSVTGKVVTPMNHRSNDPGIVTGFFTKDINKHCEIIAYRSSRYGGLTNEQRHLYLTRIDNAIFLTRSSLDPRVPSGLSLLLS